MFAPNYGSPFVRDLDNGRRYGTIEDFRNLVKLDLRQSAPPPLGWDRLRAGRRAGQQAPPRHGLRAYALLDKAFMGSVTAPERARDTVDMARLLFGADYLEDHPVILSLVNANSPLVWDSIMLGAARAYAEANQAVLVTPFILAGAMAPVTVAGASAQTLAEALGGMTFVQLVRPGAPVVLGSFASSMSMQSGAPTFGTPEPALVLYVMAALARRLGVPFRSGGSLCASKVADAQAAYESAATLQPTVLAGVNFVLHAAGWLEGGLTVGYEKFILDADQCGMTGPVGGRGHDRERPGARRDPRPTSRAPTTSAAPTPWPTSRAPSTAPRSPTTTASSSGPRMARSMPPSARTPSGSGCWRVRGAGDGPGDRRGPARVHRRKKASMPDAFV